MIEFCKSELEYYRSLIDNKDIPDELLMWSLLLITISTLEKMKIEPYTKRKDGTNWDYCMMEELDKIYEDEFFISQNIKIRSKDDHFQIIAFPSATKYNKNKVASIIHYSNAATNVNLYAEIFKQIIDNKVKYSELEQENKEQVDKYIDNNYLEVRDDNIIVHSPVISSENFNKLVNSINSSKEVVDEYINLYNSVYQKVKSLLPMNLEKQTNFIVLSAANTVRSLMLSRAYEKGIITEDINHKHFVYNMFIIK